VTIPYTFTMSERAAPTSSADITISASPETVYRLITDLPTMAELAEETTEMVWHKGDAVRPGAVFKGSNRNGNHTWTTTCTITDAEPGRVFGFDVRYAVIPVAHWRYEIVDTADGARVTESTWDQRPSWFKKIAGLSTGVSDRVSANSAHIEATLKRLKARAEAQ